MRRGRVLLVGTTLLFAAGAPLAEEMDGRQVMERVRENRRSQDVVTESVMTIHSASGQRVRQMRSYGKSYGEVDKVLMRFLGPTEVKGAGLLVWGHEERADDQWLYLPELRRVKKIAASGRNGSFMGSDFSYRDLEDRSVEEAEHEVLRSEACGEFQCYVVESVDKDLSDAVYSKSLSWIRKDTFVPVKLELYDKKGAHLKTATLEAYEQLKSTWVARKVTMENVKKGTRTVLEVHSVKIDEGLGDEYFTQQYLQRDE
jgi:outer membrane lipoprotein-sorting protein